MRLIQSKDSTLMVRDQFPRGLSLVFGVSFCGAAVALFIWVAQQAVLDCVREVTASPTCEIRRERLSGSETIAIGAPQSALIQDSTDSDGDRTYRVAIQTDLGTYPIVGYYSSGLNGKRQHRDQIERFIANPNQASLSIAIDNRIWTYPFGGVFGLVGLCFVASLFRHTIYRFDRTIRRLEIERNAFGRSQKTTYPLSAVQSVVLEESTDSDGDRLHRVSIFLDTGERLGSQSYDNLNVGTKRQLVQTLNTFLGLLPPSH